MSILRLDLISLSLRLWFQVFADVLDGELLLRVDLSGCPLSEGSVGFAQRQTETQTGAQLRAGELLFQMDRLNNNNNKKKHNALNLNILM